MRRRSLDVLVPEFVKNHLKAFPSPRLLAGNIGWQLGDKLVRLGMGALLTILIARYLGPERFGQLNFAIAFVALFGALANLGLQSIVVRDCVRYPEQRSEILSSAWGLRLLAAGAVVALAVWVIGLLRPGQTEMIWLAFLLASAWLPQAWDVVDYDFQARLRARPVVLARNLAFLLAALVKISLIACGAPLWGFAAAQLFDAILLAIFFHFLARPERQIRLPAVLREQMKRLLGEAWPAILAGLSVTLYMRIDQVMLGRMLGDEAVGVFSAAVTISEAWYFIPVAFTTAIAPALTAAFQKSAADFERQLLASMRILLWVSIVAAVALSLSAPSLIALLYGGQYLGAAPVLAMHAWAGVFVALGVSCGPWFVNHGMLKAGMYQAVAGALVNIGLNLWLIPQFGPQGAAASTVVSYATAVILFNLFDARTRPLVRLQLRSIF